MKALLAAVALGVLLVVALVVSLLMWVRIGETEISGHGLLAMGLGVALTLLLGVGLMFLVFFSSRRGYDDRARR